MKTMRMMGALLLLAGLGGCAVKPQPYGPIHKPINPQYQDRFGCSEALIYPGDYRNIKLERLDDFYRERDPIIQGASVECEISLPPSGRVAKMTRSEKINNKEINYEFSYHEGKGSIDVKGDDGETYSWTIICDADKINGQKFCGAMKDDLFVGMKSPSVPFVRIGYENYPGSDIQIRVGSHDAIKANEKTGFNEDQASLIVSEMGKSNSTVTSYSKWPHKWSIQKNTNLYGFATVWDKVVRIYDAIEWSSAGPREVILPTDEDEK